MKMVLETPERLAYRNIDAGQCPGCPSNLATKLTMQVVFEVSRTLGQDPIIFGQGCGVGRDLLQRSGIGTHDSACVGLRLALEMRGIDRPVVVIDGDGQIDMGFDDFTGAFQLGYPYMHVICDNQAYAASGSHATGMTDLLARVSTRPDGRVGKPGGHLVLRKQPAMMIKFSGARYAATASPSHLPDFENKIRTGLQQMPSFIQVFTPCNIAWGYDDDQAAHVTRLGVTSGIWPLWEWGDQGFRRTIPFQRGNVSVNLREYVGAQRRYGHVKDEDLPVMEQYVLQLNELVDRMAKAFGPNVP
jgi:pyruvate/2-oxoacid:ferredoxin oxidoreductase beta subunit